MAATCALLLFGAVAYAQRPFAVDAALEPSGGASAVLKVSFTVPEGHYLYAESINVTAVDDLTLAPGDIPSPKTKFDPFKESNVGVYEHDVVFSYTVRAGRAGTVDVEVAYQGCSATMCFLPETKGFSLVPGVAPSAPAAQEDEPANGDTEARWQVLGASFSIDGVAAGYLKPDAFVEFLDKVESGSAAGRDRLRDAFESRGLWLVVLLILVGGLALNLTPCVLPMIPVNIAIIGAGAEAGSRWRGAALGATYGTGIAIVYGALGLAVILAGSKFGMLNSSPWFNMGVGVVFLLLSLAMFDVFTIDFSRFQRGAGPGKEKRGGFLTALLLGGVAALLAGACVAPVVISVLLLSADLYARGTVAGLLLPLLLGVGMALPWPFAGAGLSFLPKPGKWMARVKIAFGVIILTSAGWYSYLGISLLVARSAVSTEKVVAAQEQGIGEGWTSSLEGGLAEALAGGKPVFIDFWASWCKSCLKMEKTTFKEAAVKERLDGYVKIKYRAEDLSDPQVKRVLDYFGAVGLPTYAVMRPAGSPTSG